MVGVVDGSAIRLFRRCWREKGRIVKIGRANGTGKTEIDATGLIVAPGFIDVHTHADEVADQPLAEIFSTWASPRSRRELPAGRRWTSAILP